MCGGGRLERSYPWPDNGIKRLSVMSFCAAHHSTLLRPAKTPNCRNARLKKTRIGVISAVMQH